MAIFFTKHAKLRIKQRSIFKEQVEETIWPGIIITKLPEAGIIKKNFCRKNIGSCYNQRKIGYHCSHGLLAKGDLA